MSDDPSAGATERFEFTAPATPFDRMVTRMEQRRYLKIVSVDYANNGAESFDVDLFAEDLGVPKSFLEDLGVVEYQDQTGWNLPKQPSPDVLAENWDDIADRREQKVQKWAELHGHEVKIERLDPPELVAAPDGGKARSVDTDSERSGGDD